MFRFIERDLRTRSTPLQDESLAVSFQLAVLSLEMRKEVCAHTHTHTVYYCDVWSTNLSEIGILRFRNQRPRKPLCAKFQLPTRPMVPLDPEGRGLHRPRSSSIGRPNFAVLVPDS